MNDAKIAETETLGTKKRFLEYAEDAPNWNNSPWVINDNVFHTSTKGAIKQNAGYIFWMKAWGWIETHNCPDTNDHYLTITDAGWAYAAEHGIEYMEMH
tara:strand:+ start:919 stop:1215 length:297 start_codon:yes stop_codon:yes gene_type:complete